jgi:8-oxo-dGTP pyrophosphatase MutT (NUDIX family)
MVRPFPEPALLAQALASRPHPPVEGVGRPAAVLVCLVDGSVLLLRRAAHPDDPWSGHVSLPGGRHDPGDRGLLGTALRETQEEVGFDPVAYGEVLGPLVEHAGRGRGIRSVRIAAFVATLRERPPIHLSPEIAAAYWVDLRSLLPAIAEVPELPVPMPAYRVAVDGGHELVVWGITHAILEHLRAVELDP